MTTAAAVLESSVEIPAPSVSIPNPKMKSAFPLKLMIFIIMEMNIGFRELPMVRKTAAPP